MKELFTRSETYQIFGIGVMVGIVLVLVILAIGSDIKMGKMIRDAEDRLKNM